MNEYEAAHCRIDALDERMFEVVLVDKGVGVRIGVYPTVELAKKVARSTEAKFRSAMRDAVRRRGTKAP